MPVFGDGTLLDHSMIVYGSGLSDGDRHTHEDLPVLLFGRGDGAFRPGRPAPHGRAEAGAALRVRCRC